MLSVDKIYKLAETKREKRIKKDKKFIEKQVNKDIKRAAKKGYRYIYINFSSLAYGSLYLNGQQSCEYAYQYLKQNNFKCANAFGKKDELRVALSEEVDPKW